MVQWRRQLKLLWSTALSSIDTRKFIVFERTIHKRARPERKGGPRRFSFIIGVIRRHMEINASLSYGVVAPASAFKINQQHRYGHKASMKWRCKAHMVQVEASIQLVEESIARHVDLGSFRLLGGSVKNLQSSHDRVLFHPGLGCQRGTMATSPDNVVTTAVAGGLAIFSWCLSPSPGVRHTQPLYQ